MERAGRRCLEKRNQRWWHCAPTFKQCIEGWRKFREIFPRSVATFHKSPLRVEFPGTGSEVEFRSTHGNAYESWRAAGLNGATFDEAGTCPEDAILTLMPMLTDDPTSQLILVGSPRGRNHFWKYWRMGHDRTTGWWSNPFAWPSFLRPSFARSEWERMKATYPAVWFRQEFLAEFLSNVLGAFQRSVAADHEYLTLLELSKHRSPLFIGADFARKRDWTVIAVVGDKGRVLYRERFQLKPWQYVAQRCAEVWRAARQPPIAIDATGLGDVVWAMLHDAGISPHAIVPFVFTGDSKAELVVTGQRLNERDMIRVPRSDTYGCGEFDAFEVDVNATGKFKFSAPEGEHDDFVIAVLLASWLAHRNERFDLGGFKFYDPAEAAA